MSSWLYSFPCCDSPSAVGPDNVDIESGSLLCLPISGEELDTSSPSITETQAANDPEGLSSSGAKGTADVSPKVMSIAIEAEAEASRLMREVEILKAEAVLAKALLVLEGMCEADEAITWLRKSNIFLLVLERVQQYESLAVMLAPNAAGFRPAWDHEGQQLWLHIPAGSTWFEYMLFSEVESSVTQCLASLNELDLAMKYEPMLAEQPVFLGPVHPLLLVSRSVISVLVFRIELIIEVCRFCDTDFGFCGEVIRSTFPHEDWPIPKKNWRDRRVGVNTQTIWMPLGGGKPGTLMMQRARVEVGIPIAEWMVKFFASRIATSCVNNLKATAARVGDPAGPYPARVKADQYGFYAKLSEVEAVASRREAISVKDLASKQAIFDRPWKLSSTPS